MNDKKKRDTIDCLRSQLKMCEEKLNDRSCAPIWDQLSLDKQKIKAMMSNLNDD